MKVAIIMTLIFGAYIFRETWQLMGSPYKIIHPFPKLPAFEITRASYVFFLWIYITMGILTACLSHYGGHWFWHVVFIVQVIELMEFLLCYNMALKTFPVAGYQIGANVTNLRFAVFAICILVEIFIQWNHSD